MSHWIDPLERRYRSYAIPGLARILVALQIVGLAITTSAYGPGLLLIGDRVLEGEWWRLFTFVFVPENTDIFFAFFTLLLLWLFGTALERRWGSFRFNVFILIGYLGTIGAAFLTPHVPHTFSLISLTVFLSFAYVFPDFELWVFFLFPVKVRWLALIAWALMGVALVNAPTWGERAAILAPVSAFFALLGTDLKQKVVTKQRAKARERAQVTQSKRAFHTCATCGKTDLSDPTEEFRYREGGLAYCSEHVGHGLEVAADPDAPADPDAAAGD